MLQLNGDTVLSLVMYCIGDGSSDSSFRGGGYSCFGGDASVVI